MRRALRLRGGEAFMSSSSIEELWRWIRVILGMILVVVAMLLAFVISTWPARPRAPRDRGGFMVRRS